MAIKEFFKRATGAFKSRNSSGGDLKTEAGDQSGTHQKAIVKPKNQQQANQRSLELIQNGLSELVTQLKDINSNLSEQSEQNKQLMSRIEHLPDMIHTLPEAVKNQSATVKALLKQMEDNQNKELEFIRAVESIPTETGKQTDALEKISGQLEASAEVDVQFTESFKKFNDSLDNFDQTSVNQTKTLEELNKTFAASDRYMKYLVQQQNKRFTWLFIISLTICLISILSAIGIFAYFLSKG